MKVRSQMNKTIALSLLALSALTQTPFARAEGEGEGRNPDGYDLPGDWTKNGQVVLPTIQKGKMEELRSLIEQLAPPPPRAYSSLFGSADQPALDEAEATAMVVYDQVSHNVRAVKEYLATAVSMIHHAKEEGKTRASAQRVAFVTDRYRTLMQKSVNSIMHLLDTSQPAFSEDGDDHYNCKSQWDNCKLSYYYHKDTEGKIDGVVKGSPYQDTQGFGIKAEKVIVGTGDLSACRDATSRKGAANACGWHRFVLDTTFQAPAKNCSSSACVFEISGLATSMLEEMYEWNTEFDFDSKATQSLKLFFEPRNKFLVSALSTYIDDKLKNKDVNAFRYAVTSFTNLLYIPLVAPADAITYVANLRAIRSSFEFRPTYLECNFGIGSDQRKCRRKMRYSNRLEKVSASFAPIFDSKAQSSLN